MELPPSDKTCMAFLDLLDSLNKACEPNKCDDKA